MSHCCSASVVFLRSGVQTLYGPRRKKKKFIPDDPLGPPWTTPWTTPLTEKEKMDPAAAQRRLQLVQLQLTLMNQMMQNYGALIRVMMEEDEAQLQQHQRQRRPRTCWVRNWLRRRPALGAFSCLVRELRVEDPRAFRNLLRVEPDLFNEIAERLRGRIERQ